MRRGYVHRLPIACVLVVCGLMSAEAGPPAKKAPAPGAPGQAAPKQKPSEQKPSEQKPSEQKPSEQKPSEQKPSAEQIAAARKDFLDVARVLQSPRCRNCHPAGDAPLHGDAGVPHIMNITRRSPEVGIQCTACHRDQNAPMEGGPPGVPNWHMPPAGMPMVFEGLSPHALCVQLKDPAQNGGKDLAGLVTHVREDALVHWGWSPGPGRSKPPLPHAVFVEKVERWAAAGGPCPE